MDRGATENGHSGAPTDYSIAWEHGQVPTVDFLSSLVFRIATRAERPAILLFRKAVFEQEHAYAPLDRFDADAVHLVAVEPSARVVSAARFLLPTQRPFDLEAIIDFQSFLPHAAVPAMVGGFSVHPDFRGINTSLLIQVGMLKLTCVLAQRHAVTDIIIYTFDHLVNFYKTASFEPIDKFFHHGYEKEMTVMHLNLHAFEKVGLGKRTRMRELLSQVQLEL